LKWRPDGLKVEKDGATEDGITIMSRSRGTEDWAYGYKVLDGLMAPKL
jgi:hypothetical protein